MTCLKAITLVLTCYLSLLSSVEAHRCFVCIPSVKKNDNEVLSLVNEFLGETIQKCEDFTEPARESFIKECPDDSIGCLTQFQGRTFLRSCARVGIDICKEANNVTYCYCSSNECNTPERRLADPLSYVESVYENNNELIDIDDEDHYGFSGDSGSTYNDSEDYNSLEEDITEFPPDFIPRIILEGNIQEEKEKTNVTISQIEGSSDHEIVFSEDYYVFEEKEDKENEKQEEDIQIVKKDEKDRTSSKEKSPSKSTSMSSSVSIVLTLSLATLLSHHMKG